MILKTRSEGVRRLSLALGLIGALAGCISGWLAWEETNDQLELAKSSHREEYRGQLLAWQAWNVLPQARGLAVQVVEGSNELSEEIKSRSCAIEKCARWAVVSGSFWLFGLVEGLLEGGFVQGQFTLYGGLPKENDLPLEDKILRGVVPRILVVVPINEGRLDGGAFAARVREQLEGYRTALRSVRAGRLSQVPSGYSGDKSQMFLPLGKRGVAGHLWWVTVPDYQPQLPSPPSRSPSEYVWPLIFPFLGFSLPWLTVRSIAWISGGSWRIGNAKPKIVLAKLAASKLALG